MMVMLLQRLTAPQSTYSLENKTNYLCDYFEKQDNNNNTNNNNNTSNSSNNNQQLLLQQVCCDNEFNSIGIIKPINNNNNNNNNNTYYCNNISKNNNYSNNNINTQSDKDKLRTSVCYRNKTVITNNNNKNNSSNNNNNGYNEEDTEDDQQLLARDKFQNKRHQETIITNSLTTASTTTAGTAITGASAAASAGAAASGTTSTLSASQGRFCAPGQGVAMRYYRLWIYASNIVLLGSAIGLAAAVARTLLFTSDPRRYLIPGVPRALDPTALYAYLALATQLGLLQLLGCIAARRLSARLLNAYWLLLLALLFGDTIIGVAWIFRFERIRAELRPSLRLKLQLDYGRDLRFSDQWDQLQREFSCCGIVGPSDFDGQFNYPDSCCPVVETLVKDSITTATVFDRSSGQGNIIYNINETNINIVGIGTDNDADDSNLVDEGGGCQQPFVNGCEEYLMGWLRKTADLLFVLGYCVMAFAKLCFLGILRYEIREMIQKIRLLREPPPPATSQYIQSLCQPVHAPAPIPAATTAAATTMTALTAATTTNTTTMMMMTGSDQRGSCGGGDSAAAMPSITGNNNIPQLPAAQHLINYHHQDHTSNKHSFLYTSNLQQQQQQDTGADSDTNSHCALILEESSTPTPPVTQRNCHHPLITGLRESKSKNNGNNNYEMREFNRRYLIANGDPSSPAITGNQPGIKIITQSKRT
ncbi:uncharacterized protein LOC123261129 isoform X1 [Cotesia glomerata]|uniref:uncharacterized protein LOC123261129 isoform X1 n=1 Tax=Cotesia glomerata TaxID=32391 RepID=UPI001D018915|nr:uncharacterized protein LOC123261129 isoform X1 [Cotesia glomerata]XP_044578573.1 uncharacterized protein LOC123261129 isoform X1 [Cotesia glomerata]XP_044578574.1 uncharacterized protein LOC123261129 isoform X1 [Cotesia glomerata]